jgi:hypothetical protein
MIGAMSFVVMVLVTIVALGSRSLPGTGTSRDLIADVPFDPGAVVRWLLILGLLVVVATAFLLPEPERAVRRMRRRTKPIHVLMALAFVALMLGLGWLFAGERRDGRRGTGAGTESTVVLDGVEPQGAGSNLILFVLLAAVAAAALIIGVVGRRGSRGVEAPPVGGAVTEAIDRALAELEYTDDPRRTVLVAYANMEAAFAKAGTRRKASETPEQFLRRALRERAVGLEPIARLTRLFEVARFSTHPVDQSMSVEARSLLAAVKHDLESPR